jgi:prepilin-type processing-associated H-X9-DG protein
LSSTMMVGEVVDAHTAIGTNIWSTFQRHCETCRTTENPLNTAQGQGSTLSGTSYCTGGSGNFASRHPGGGNFAFADGSVVFLSENIQLSVYRAFSTIAGNEVIPGNGY